MKDGKSLGYGIIEYKSWQEAEKSERHLNGHKVLDVPMRITYCIPGISAVTICTRLMSKFVSKYRKNDAYASLGKNIQTYYMIHVYSTKH